VRTTSIDTGVGKKKKKLRKFQFCISSASF
jgi:hypothetical protein